MLASATGATVTTVVVVDDSPTARYALRRSLEAAGTIQVIGEAENSVQALRVIAEKKPQVVTMDVHLRSENGIDLTRRIMSQCPVPIVIVTGEGHRDPELAFRALSAGALDIRGKLPHENHPDYARKSARLIRLIGSLASVPVITQRHRADRPIGSGRSAAIGPSPQSSVALVAIGASTGGPPVVQTILSKLGHPFPLPIVVVQHIADGFTAGLAQWLHETTHHNVEVVRGLTRLSAGVVYFAPEGNHLVQTSATTVDVVQAANRNFHCPSIEVYFESVARYVGASAAAVLLTGMGSDGGRALVDIRRARGTVVVQSPESCVVSSMPNSALALDPTIARLAPDEVGMWMAGLSRITPTHLPGHASNAIHKPNERPLA